MTIQRMEVGPRMSQVVVHGDMVYLAGQVADDHGADIATQTQQILARIDALLAQAGTDKSKILTAQIWLRDIGDFAAMNAVWDPWVSPGNPPARACVEAKLAVDTLLVEIMVVATK